MGAAPHMENLPRTVELVRAANGAAELVYVDQRRLPRELVFARTSDWREVVGAVKSLAVRGAPAIGAAGAAAVALWAQERARAGGKAGESYLAALSEACALVAGARPTAVNLAWGVGRMERAACDCAAAGEGPDAIAGALFSAVKELEAADEAANRAIGAHGAALLPRGARVLTHCNAGSLATVFYGTALGVVYAAAAKGGIERVYADETRPVGQGARLTCWELARAGVSVTLLCDNMAASLMARARWTPWWWARIASRPTGTQPTRWARTAWPCSPRTTASRSTWPRPNRPSIAPFPTARASPSRSAIRPRWPNPCPAWRCGTPRST